MSHDDMSSKLNMISVQLKGEINAYIERNELSASAYAVRVGLPWHIVKGFITGIVPIGQLTLEQFGTLISFHNIHIY